MLCRASLCPQSTPCTGDIGAKSREFDQRMGQGGAWGGGSKQRKRYVQRAGAILWAQVSGGRSTKACAKDVLKIP